MSADSPGGVGVARQANLASPACRSSFSAFKTCCKDENVRIILNDFGSTGGVPEHDAIIQRQSPLVRLPDCPPKDGFQVSNRNR